MAIAAGVHAAAGIALDEESAGEELGSDAEMQMVVAAGLAASKEKFKWRGHLLAAHMRKIKAAHAKSRPRAVAAHVRDRIQRFNTGHAVREDDLANVDEKKEAKIKGRGAYQRWLPDAIQRSCWGGRPRTLHKKWRLRAKQPQPSRVVAPLAISCNAWASFMQGAGTHVQAIRGAVAAEYMQTQCRAMQELREQDIPNIIVEIAFDETEMPFHLDLNGEVTCGGK